MTEQPVCFYYRDGCHLCEEMAAALHRGWPEVLEAMQWRDVDAQESWRAAFGERVPVLTLGDEILCQYRIDPARVQAHFGASLNPL